MLYLNPILHDMQNCITNRWNQNYTLWESRLHSRNASERAHGQAKRQDARDRDWASAAIIRNTISQQGMPIQRTDSIPSRLVTQSVYNFDELQAVRLFLDMRAKVLA
jgi:hypothetical protein